MTRCVYRGHHVVGIAPYVKDVVSLYRKTEFWNTMSYAEILASAFKLYRRKCLRSQRFQRGIHLFFLGGILFSMVALCLLWIAIPLFFALPAKKMGFEIGFNETFLLWCLASIPLLSFLLFLGRQVRLRWGKKPEETLISEDVLDEVGTIFYLWFVEAPDSPFPYKEELAEKFHLYQKAK